MPPAGKPPGELYCALEEFDRPSLQNLTSSNYGTPGKVSNELLESLGKSFIICRKKAQI